MVSTALVVLFVLATTSAILCCALTLAWLHFGRQRHALTWALAYGGGTLQWALNAVTLVLLPGHPAMILLGALLILTNSSLIAIGSRQRAGLRPYVGRFASGVAITGAAIAVVMLVFQHFGMRIAITNLYIASMTVIAIMAVLPQKHRARPPEIAFMVMLAIFGMYQLALAALGITIGAEADPAGIDRFRAFLVLGLPPIHIGTGIATLFLLAGDLADGVRALVTRDPLTGNLNRRGIEQAAVGAIANARRHGRPLTVVMSDIDRFKRINDRFGHAAGDRALIAFADHVHASVREEDLFGRMGGDEFCLLLIDITPADAAAAIERTRQELQQLEISGLPGCSITASFGIAAFDPGDVGFGDMLHRADIALLEAKMEGRDRLVVAPTPKPRISGTEVR